jgi:2'-5' RNA ligase
VYDDAAPEALADRLDALPARRPIRLRFPTLGVFPASAVLHLAPAASPALTALHAAVHRTFKAQARPHFRPGEWAPHCTLASGLDAAALGAATAALAADFDIVQATLTALAVVEFPPARLHRRLQLGGQR